ncbi:hypothetical protein EN828_05535 [Mesorhizobium sp. M2D.F.Ca.ET.185.01.1.1]|uniref:hypothetical protein n=1 Tax=unclassified Mesorhizobium TaxID=325217 RepID=UPI000FCBABB2|nr:MULTISPECIES: hypothetical protein [unclassified Mesorhizobium]TGP77434.1 hypothetical protein EN870_19570 [bacterium M00.F.Ca.ET.227.01.1.1]TGP93229.1 hypothetical protein EN865_19765 [bacterium M00.F.Ca.ET.222.01.1.1]TGP96775.1 hypothetical protein EN864_10050 [bacterium M00.F.Ca.ET.221.01.1.1]TGT94979.1 hypothetical protein EN806_54365 [bacterium M00.F.Ca.ET.163.01.1.1]TGU21192.1 hypothetical protein EN799_54725 [bacterium M00.F.Ca.ET.156.01.1.1]TGU49987.1 hypothetical protein EN789_054
MKSYIVEIMSGGSATSHQIAAAETPLQAARAATGRDVWDRREETTWVRVTDEADGVVYSFAFRMPGT